jgi:CheY-like chemotaxis protein
MKALSGLNILLVEDEFLIALDAEQALRSLGADRVAVASTLREADKIAERDEFDLVVLDVNINGEMSFPVAEKFSARGVPVVFATGYDLRGRDTLKGGCGVCIEKPYTSERLQEAVRAALASTRTTAPSAQV